MLLIHCTCLTPSLFQLLASSSEDFPSARFLVPHLSFVACLLLRRLQRGFSFTSISRYRCCGSVGYKYLRQVCPGIAEGFSDWSPVLVPKGAAELPLFGSSVTSGLGLKSALNISYPSEKATMGGRLLMPGIPEAE